MPRRSSCESMGLRVHLWRQRPQWRCATPVHRSPGAELRCEAPGARAPLTSVHRRGSVSDDVASRCRNRIHASSSRDTSAMAAPCRAAPSSVFCHSSGLDFLAVTTFRGGNPDATRTTRSSTARSSSCSRRQRTTDDIEQLQGGRRGSTLMPHAENPHLVVEQQEVDEVARLRHHRSAQLSERRVSGHRKRSRTLGGRGEGRQEFALEEPGRLRSIGVPPASSGFDVVCGCRRDDQLHAARIPRRRSINCSSVTPPPRSIVAFASASSSRVAGSSSKPSSSTQMVTVLPSGSGSPSTTTWDPTTLPRAIRMRES